MQDKVLILSHGSDADGSLPVILTNLIYNDVESIFLEVNETDDKVLGLLEDTTYDLIYMVDLSISDETCKKVMNSPLKAKFKIFDHHASKMEISKYPFVTLININDDGIKECGTTIYYKYLKSICDNPILDKQVTKEVIELVRQIDTWDWVKTNNIAAKNISDLYDIIGRESFIENITNKIVTEDTFDFTNEEKYLLEMEMKRIDNYIAKKKERLMKIKIDNYNIGVVFAELYRSELGNRLAALYENELDFIMIINVDKSVSYRSLNDVDVSIFAKKYNGGGHKNASGSSISNDIRKKILENLFGNVEFLDEN